LLYFTLWDSWQFSLPLEQHCCHISVRLELLCSHIQGCKCTPASSYQWRPKSNTAKEKNIFHEMTLSLSGLVLRNFLNYFLTKKIYFMKFRFGSEHSAINSFVFWNFLDYFTPSYVQNRLWNQCYVQATIFYSIWLISLTLFSLYRKHGSPAE
jgi:hypothetical protein